MDYDLESYDYELPPDLIAQYPCPDRPDSRLMVLDRATGKSTSCRFLDIKEHLVPGSLLVANNTRVLPARLTGKKASGGKVEFLLLTPLPLITPQRDGLEKTALVDCLLKASKHPRPGQWIEFSTDTRFKILERGEMGRARGELRWKGDLVRFFIENGRVPLPPYIQRKDDQNDHDRYQTVYASEDKIGSVAAPTAGLHFSPEFKDELEASGFGWAEVTLYVGYGTFSPVRCRDIREHPMHPEYIEVSPEAASRIREARKAGAKIVGIGTTTARTLESVGVPGEKMTAHQGWTDLFIYPGYKFKVIDQLVTNFHLPRSSLLMMVSALAGRECILNAYNEAGRQGFRFFSYGDAMFIK
ncbi:tRNA preQ1(34) S-adenosylmethionine ribosyltransferase-isomerase QueA [Desulfonatronovibrio hydrogenovorans]|uniref:tRNA preQ1(34) S-adenosylmethionine ribosyltransferase-isomerase QueA n=1 Tax=Desulfonatronovibrio hydrogenovorans TaxID=53245 RepID=UPI001FC9091C|nr:tRNA preQ1(34) S-adenosylmethionine ribosyltransferase-isomerase QueA [Desulfonatronovibrio hydrogenovorans]